jgi:hypothetical protein
MVKFMDTLDGRNKRRITAFVFVVIVTIMEVIIFVIVI